VRAGGSLNFLVVRINIFEPDEKCGIPAGIAGWHRQVMLFLFVVFLKKDLTVCPFLSSYPTRELNHHSLSIGENTFFQSHQE